MARPKSATYAKSRPPSSGTSPQIIVQDVSFQHQQFFPPKSWSTRPSSASTSSSFLNVKERGKSKPRPSEKSTGLPQLMISNTSMVSSATISPKDSSSPATYYDSNFVYDNTPPTFSSMPYGVSSDYSDPNQGYLVPPPSSAPAQSSPRSTSPRSNSGPSPSSPTQTNTGVWIGLNYTPQAFTMAHSLTRPSPASPSSPRPSKSSRQPEQPLLYNVSTLAAAINSQHARQLQLNFNEKVARPLSREVRRKNEREREKEQREREKRQKDLEFNERAQQVVSFISYVSPPPTSTIRPSSAARPTSYRPASATRPSSSSKISRSFRPSSASRGHNAQLGSIKVMEITNALLEEEPEVPESQTPSIPQPLPEQPLPEQPQEEPPQQPRPKENTEPHSVTLSDTTMRAYVNQIVKDLGEQSLEESSTRRLVHEDLSKTPSQIVLDISHSNPQLLGDLDLDGSPTTSPEKPQEQRDNWSPSPRPSRLRTPGYGSSRPVSRSPERAPELSTKANVLLLSHKIAQNLGPDNPRRRPEVLRDDEHGIEILYGPSRTPQRYQATPDEIQARPRPADARSSIKVVLPLSVLPYNSHLRDEGVKNQGEKEPTLSVPQSPEVPPPNESSLEGNSSVILPVDLSNNVVNSLQRFHSIVGHDKQAEQDRLNDYLVQKQAEARALAEAEAAQLSRQNQPVDIQISWRSFLPSTQPARQSAKKQAPQKLREEVVAGGLVDEDDDEVLERHKRVVEIPQESGADLDDESNLTLKNIQSLSIFKRGGYYPLPGDTQLEEKMIREAILGRLKSQARERTQATARSLNISPPSLSPRIMVEMPYSPDPPSPRHELAERAYSTMPNPHGRHSQTDVVLVNRNESARFPNQRFNGIAPANQPIKEINALEDTLLSPNKDSNCNIKDTPWVNIAYHSASPPSSRISSPFTSPKIHSKAILMPRN